MAIIDQIPGRFSSLSDATLTRVPVALTDTTHALSATTRRVEIAAVSGGDVYFDLNTAATVAGGFPILSGIANVYYVSRGTNVLHFIADTDAASIAIWEFAA